MHCRKETIFILSCAAMLTITVISAHANPYLPKPGEAPLHARVGTCSITGGFIHFYSALFNGLFDKCGLKVEHVTLAAAW